MGSLRFILLFLPCSLSSDTEQNHRVLLFFKKSIQFLIGLLAGIALQGTTESYDENSNFSEQGNVSGAIYLLLDYLAC